MIEPIESKELRGISIRTMLTVIICTGSIMLTVLGTYFNLKADVTDVRVTKDSDAKLNDLKMRIMDQRIDAMGIQLKDINTRIENSQTK